MGKETALEWVAKSLTITNCTREHGHLGRNMSCPVKEYEVKIGHDTAQTAQKLLCQICTVQKGAEI
jgi:hypothetical protein